MPLLNLEFIILIVKVMIAVLPGVLGIFLIASTEETKRSIRNTVCNKLFGVSNAIEYPKFQRFLLIVGVLAILYSIPACWFLLLRKFF
ncbi:MAG TPA: hypothetical protein DCX06_05685 [Opitutae bacterium]|nr:hypothetical protein [Opitutae bacterium]